MLSPSPIVNDAEDYGKLESGFVQGRLAFYLSGSVCAT